MSARVFYCFLKGRMQTVEQRDSEITKPDVRVHREILQRWVERVSQIRVSQDREPIINKEKFLSLLEVAQTTQVPLHFVAIGCQDWVKPGWGDPTVDRIMGKISGDNKRAQRFITEMAEFSKALTTLRVPHAIHFSLSDIEALIHIHLQNMGLVIHNSNAAELLDKNVAFLSDKLQGKGAPVEPFIHSEVLKSLLHMDSLEELQKYFSGQDTVHYRVFLDALYEFDLRETAQHLVGIDELGPVWLDIQSFNFGDDVIALENAAKAVAPEMPILSLFPNAGNWHAGQQTSASFPSRESIVAEIIQSNTTPQTQAEWVNRLHKTKDATLNQAIQTFGHEAVTITSGEEKTLAVRLFFQLVFGFDPLEQGAQEDI